MNYIYIIQNLVNDKIYVGQTINVRERWYEEKRELRHGKTFNDVIRHPLVRSWAKHGEENFSFYVIDETEDSQEALTIEESIRVWFTEMNMCYNIAQCSGKPPIKKGPDHHNFGKKFPSPTTEVREKLSKASIEWHKTHDHPMLGKHHTEESRKKISDATKESWKKTPRVMTEAGKASRKEKLSQYKGEIHHAYGKKISDEHKKKVSESNIGRIPPNVKYFTTFGETKTLKEWVRDPRCLVSFTTLRSRVFGSKWGLEEALIIPFCANRKCHKIEKDLDE